MSEETKKNAAAPEAEQAEPVKPAETAEQAAQAGAENAAPPEEPKEDLHAKLAAAESAAQAARTQAEQLKDQLLRTAAEFDNFRKRSAREQDAAYGNGVAGAVKEILTILDALEMAEAAPTADENYKKGVTMTLEKARGAFNALKVEEIPALGQAFDPAVHNAVMQKPAEAEGQSGTVVQVFQKGYRLGDKVIRHASVVVAE